MRKALLLIFIVMFPLPLMVLAQGDNPVRLQVSDEGAFIYDMPDGWMVEGSREELTLASSELALFLMENSPNPIVQLPEGETVISIALMDPQVLISTFDLPEDATPVELLDALAFWLDDFLALEAAEQFEVGGQEAAISRKVVDGQSLDVLVYFMMPDRIAVVTIVSNGDIPQQVYDIIESVRYRRQTVRYEDDHLVADVPLGWEVERGDQGHIFSNVIEKVTQSSFDLEAGEYVFTVMNLTPGDDDNEVIDLAALAMELAEEVAGNDPDVGDAQSFRLPGDLVPVEGRTFVHVVFHAENSDEGGVVVTQNKHLQTIALVYKADDGEAIAWTAIWTALTVRFK